MDRILRTELGVGALGLATAVTCALVLPGATIDLAIADLFKWAAVILLGQGLLRDLAIIAARRAGCSCAGGHGRMLLCVESGAGILLLADYALLRGLGAGGAIAIAPWCAVMLASLWWLVGTGLRNWVVELRCEADHLNVVVGFGR